MSISESLSRDELLALVQRLESLIEKLVAQVSELTARVAALETENARLRTQLAHKDGSDDPLSSAGGPTVPSWVKANRRRKADEGSKKRKKRKENHSRKCEPATEEVFHAVEVCPDCGRTLHDGWEHRRRQVIDLPRQPYVVRDHVVIRRHCGVCRKDHVPKLDLSSEVVGKSRVSIRIMGLVAFLKTECRMSLSSIQRLLKSLYGLSLSVGELTGLLHRVAEEGREQYEDLREEVRSSAVVHADETGWREDGINGYLWAFLTKAVQFFVRDQSRGSAVPLAVLTEHFAGILVSDFYSGYGPLPCAKQRCWVHLLRDLKALEEEYPESKSIATWRSNIRTLYKKAVAYRERQLAFDGPVSFGVLDQRRKTRDRFEEALLKLAEPYLDNHDDPRRVLAGRMRKFLFQLFVFLEHPNVAPDNNYAERSLRPAVMARKMSGGTRSAKGSETMAILKTLFGTWELRGLKSLDACHTLLAQTAR
jgi:uncharacterized small protein (DUF1192 family)